MNGITLLMSAVRRNKVVSAQANWCEAPVKLGGHSHNRRLQKGLPV